jgi:hypothetical protein
LQTLTKNNATRATDAHIALVGHITADELRRYLTTTEMANGFANRICWACVRRSKELPEGGRTNSEALAALQGRLTKAVAFAKSAGEIHRDTDAQAIWASVYHQLTEERSGLTGAMTARAEAHVVRLSLLYALLDCSPSIQPAHLMAALSVWDYCERSVKYIFGDSLGDSLADELLRLIRASPDGLPRNQMMDYFGRNQSSDRIGKALALLGGLGLIRCEREETGGRPREVWRAVPK